MRPLDFNIVRLGRRSELLTVGNSVSAENSRIASGKVVEVLRQL